MTWSNERDVMPSEEVVDSDAGKRWTATHDADWRAEAREAAALELVGKLEALGLHDPEVVAAERRSPEESLDCPVFAKTGQISCILAREEWRRLVAALPPGNPQCPMQLLRPSWSALRLRLQCTQHQSPLWKFSCGKTCALSPVSDVGLGEVLYRVPFRDTWLAAGVHTFYFTVCKRRVLSAEHQSGRFRYPRVPQERPCNGDRRAFEGAAALPELVGLASRYASCGFRKREDDLAGVTGAARRPNTFSGVLFTCMLRAALHASASRIPFSAGSMREHLRHGGTMPVAWIWRVSSSLCPLSG